MDRAFAVSLLILILLIYSIVPWNRSECFTDTTAPPILYTCPNGGTLKSDGKTCSDRTINRTYTCPSDLRFEQHGDMPRCCNDSTCYFTPDNGTCPKGFDKKDKKCYRSEYEAKKSCPEFYKLDVKGKNCVSVDLEERFTDAVPTTPTCPSGGILDGKKCVHSFSQTCTCRTGYNLIANDLCCKDSKCGVWHTPFCPQCPNDYRRGSTSCTRVYDPTLTCPTGYEVQTIDKGSTCFKCPTGYVIKNDGKKVYCVKS